MLDKDNGPVTIEPVCFNLGGKSLSLGEIHKWLDNFAGKPGIGMKHRKFRHHESGIQQAFKLFGGKADMVAKQHIISDLKKEGWIEGVDPFLKNEADYVN